MWQFCPRKFCSDKNMANFVPRNFVVMSILIMPSFPHDHFLNVRKIRTRVDLCKLLCDRKFKIMCRRTGRRTTSSSTNYIKKYVSSSVCFPPLSLSVSVGVGILIRKRQALKCHSLDFQNYIKFPYRHNISMLLGLVKEVQLGNYRAILRQRQAPSPTPRGRLGDDDDFFSFLSLFQ